MLAVTCNREICTSKLNCIQLIAVLIAYNRYSYYKERSYFACLGTKRAPRNCSLLIQVKLIYANERAIVVGQQKNSEHMCLCVDECRWVCLLANDIHCRYLNDIFIENGLIENCITIPMNATTQCFWFIAIKAR